jgi:hypothetical protein
VSDKAEKLKIKCCKPVGKEIFFPTGFCLKNPVNVAVCCQNLFASMGVMCYNILNNYAEEWGFMDIAVGTRVQMKKSHPCGCNTFVITRIGMDFKIRCEQCGREIMMPRSKCEKGIKKILEDN